MVLFGTRGPLLCRVIRGAYSCSMRLGARCTQSLTSELRLTLEPECPTTGLAIAGEDPQGGNGIGSETLSCLWLQIFGVKRDSFLPHCQGDRGNLPRPLSLLLVRELSRFEFSLLHFAFCLLNLRNLWIHSDGANHPSAAQFSNHLCSRKPKSSTPRRLPSRAASMASARRFPWPSARTSAKASRVRR